MRKKALQLFDDMERKPCSSLMTCKTVMIFELDQGNFGNTYESFQKHWNSGKFGNEVSWHSQGVDGNHEWLEGFILWTGTLITIGAAVGALTLASVLTFARWSSAQGTVNETLSFGIKSSSFRVSMYG